jgi:hypothetical protein
MRLAEGAWTMKVPPIVVRVVWMMTPELMDGMSIRDNAGNRLIVEWGKPDTEGYYAPEVTVDYTDNVVAIERARILEIIRWTNPMMFHPDAVKAVRDYRAAVIAAIKGETTDAS